MSYWQRNTIVLLCGSLFGASFYFGIVIWQSVAAGAIVAPKLWVWLSYFILQVGLSTFGVLVLNRKQVRDIKDLDRGEDERDRIIRNRSEAMNGHIASACVILCLALWFWHQNTAILFHSIVAAMLIGEIGRGLHQFFSYDRAI